VGPPPVLSSGAELYQGAALERFSAVVKKFEERYGVKPSVRISHSLYLSLSISLFSLTHSLYWMP
jgi:hypothetical protein